MKNLLLVLAVVFMPYLASAQYTVSGQISDAVTGEALPGATVLLNQKTAAVTNAEGAFTFADVAAGSHTIRVSYLGFEAFNQTIEVPQATPLQISLKKGLFLKDEVLVTATRANEKTGTTFTNLSREEIEERNFGQDIPYILDQTPSVVVNSDAGAGVGYTGIRIRGSDITRINVTVNGIPINDPESHGTFFVNMPDFASSVEDIQVQRGVGTSTNGAGAFGASINIQSLGLRREAYAETDNTFGSYNTRRHNVRFGTGLIDNKFAFDARLSSISSDGYIDRAFSDLKSYYFSGGYHGEKTTVKFITFAGNEHTYQAWYGTPEARITGDSAALQDYIARNFLSSADSANLVNSDRRYNYYTYDNETDNYKQDHYQLHLSHDLNENWNIGGALHYTYGRGYYEQYKARQKFADYGLDNVVIGNQTITRTDLIRQRWLDNHFYGVTYALNYTGEGRVSATIGGALNRYTGDHFGEVIWAQYASNGRIRHRYYDDNAVKTDFNIFAKVNVQVTDKLNLFGDMQYRKVDYSFFGVNENLESGQQEVSYNFFNPKAGLTFALADNQHIYASYAVGNREPVRRDFVESTPGSRPLHETLYNAEAGYRVNGIFGENALYRLEANLFYMNYDNQLVLTGQINDVGGYTRTNIKDSYRRGVELAGSMRVAPFEIGGTLALSQNKIRNFTEFIDDYDNDSTFMQLTNEFSETDIAFSPNVIVSGFAEIEPVNGLKIALLHKYVGDQFLDNTSNQNRMIGSFGVTDLRLRYTVRPVKLVKALEFGLLVNNILNRKYVANGYTFGYKAGGSLITENFYYPQATRNFLVSVGIKF